MGRSRKPLIALAVALVLFTIVGFFVLPPLVKSVLTDKLAEALHRPVIIGSVSINPYTLRLTVRDFQIMERSGNEAFLTFQELSTGLDVSSLVKQTLIVRDLQLVNPYLHIVRQTENTYNFSDLLTGLQAAEKPKPRDAKPFTFSVNNIRIVGGRIDFVDGPVQKNHAVTDLDLSIPFISNTAYQADLFTQPALSMKINGAPY
ncbi:MAG: DUF748 domain-containing protein, partial [Syntrophales bacterium]|nr:DUF748 domain-containing protein [Syntrophales bacterium]